MELKLFEYKQAKRYPHTTSETINYTASKGNYVNVNIIKDNQKNIDRHEVDACFNNAWYY